MGAYQDRPLPRSDGGHSVAPLPDLAELFPALTRKSDKLKHEECSVADWRWSMDGMNHDVLRRQADALDQQVKILERQLEIQVEFLELARDERRSRENARRFWENLVVLVTIVSVWSALGYVAWRFLL